MGYRTYTCPVSRECGGCEWLAVPYPIQLERKREYLDRLFSELGERVPSLLADRPGGLAVDEVVGMDEPLHYRAKAMTPYVRGPRGLVLHGMYRKGTHRVVQTRTCLAEREEAQPILHSIAVLARRFRIEPYDEDRGTGLLRHAVVRIAGDGAAMVTIVVNRKEFPRKKGFVAALRERHPNIATVVFNVNTRQTNAVLGPLDMVAYGQGWVADELCGCTFRIPAGAFYQTNPQATETLYGIAVDTARLRDGDRVLDAYCGIGTIGIVASKGASISLVGVESVEAAVHAARENARSNHVADAEFFAGDAGDVLVDLSEGGSAAFDVVFMDPPRSGASECFCEQVLAAAPRRIVYISCNPATQVRDLERLAPGYCVERVVGVDMFPHTKHVETVVSMVRVEKRRRGVEAGDVG